MTKTGQGKELRLHYDGGSNSGMSKKTTKKRKAQRVSRDSSVSESLTSESRSTRSAKSWRRNHNQNNSETSRAGSNQRVQHESSDDDGSDRDHERVSSKQSHLRKRDLYEDDEESENDTSRVGGGYPKRTRITGLKEVQNINQEHERGMSDGEEVIVTSRSSRNARVRSSEAQERRRELEDENEDLKTRILELQHAAQRIENNFVRGKLCGKNKIRKKDAMTMTDRLNATQINVYLKQNLFPHVKFLPTKWMRYSEKDRTLCARIMALVKVPTMVDKKTYWANILCPMINEKWCAVRANIKECIRIQYLC